MSHLRDRPWSGVRRSTATRCPSCTPGSVALLPVALLPVALLPVALLLAVLVVSAAGCGGGGAANRGMAPTPPVAGTAERNGVRVDVRVELTGDGDGVAWATFTPQQPGFHLYGAQLPAQGVDGVGRPTRVRLAGGLAGSGAVTADRDVIALRVPGVSAPMPVYPDGPVTLRLPVRRSAGGGAAVAVVGYAACSVQTCLPPVSDLAIPLATR